MPWCFLGRWWRARYTVTFYKDRDGVCRMPSPAVHIGKGVRIAVAPYEESYEGRASPASDDGGLRTPGGNGGSHGAEG